MVYRRTTRHCAIGTSWSAPHGHTTRQLETALSHDDGATPAPSGAAALRGTATVAGLDVGQFVDLGLAARRHQQL